MPFVQVIGQLGLYLILAQVLPATIIVVAGITLFPNVMGIAEKHVGHGATSLSVVVGAMVLVSFLHAGVPWVMERAFFDRIWSLKPYPSAWRISQRREIWNRAFSIIAHTGAAGLEHGHYSQTFGQFILFFNSAFWLLMLSVVRLVQSMPTFGQPTDFGFWAALVILSSSLTYLFWVAPIFKKSTLDILETLDGLAKVN